MSYYLKTAEPIAAGIRRVAREQLEAARCEIGKVTAGKEAAAVHATRRHIKKIRALLRLIREAIGKQIFKEENHRLRAVGRGFSGARDARVQLQLLKKLRAHAPGGNAAFQPIATALQAEIAAHTDCFGPQRREAERALQGSCDRLDGWPLDELGMDDLCCALRHSYQRGRDCFHRLCSKPTTENFHTWRKRMKDIRYQARLLQNLNPVVICEMADAAKKLGRQLGDLHDLAFFRSRWEGAAKLPQSERTALLGLVCARERALERTALDLGARFFAEKPGALEWRLLRDAEDWRPPPGSA